jgi:salicylate hydroxylase
MLPDQGQGGGQAIEDGVALGELFTKNTRPEQVPDILNIYQAVRYDRATTVQRLSKDAAAAAPGVPKLNRKINLIISPLKAYDTNT